MTDRATGRRTLAEIEALAAAALAAAGATAAHAAAIARSIAGAEADGARAIGLAHLPAYLDALEAGRADGAAEPVVERPAGAVLRVDARGGAPHLGVERAWPALIEAAQAQGIAALALRGGYTCGGLTWFVRRLAAEHGLAALMTANAAPALLPVSGGRRPAFCTNPLAFATPVAGGDPIVIDQSSSAAAYVRIREAAAQGEAIPEGWALGPDGAPTTDPRAALEGVLLPFGGARGANIALLVELLSAGLTGAAFAYEAAPFNRGRRPPGVGLFLLAIRMDATAGPGAGARIAGLVAHLLEEPEAHLPGRRKAAAARRAAREGVAVDAALWASLEAYAKRGGAGGSGVSGAS